MNKLTKEQAIVVMGFTGIVCAPFSDFHEDVQKKLGRSIWTHEFGNEIFAQEIKDLYKEDFLKIAYGRSDEKDTLGFNSF